MADELILTREGYDKIEKEHEELVSIRRREVSERIKEALSYGDISENAEYDAAKNEQAELEERILKLENMLGNATVINDEDISTEIVNVGLKVEVKDCEDGEVCTFSIVGSSEIDPMDYKISNESPVGSALMGRKVGETVEVQIPNGIVKYEILSISKK